MLRIKTTLLLLAGMLYLGSCKKDTSLVATWNYNSYRIIDHVNGNFSIDTTINVTGSTVTFTADGHFIFKESYSIVSPFSNVNYTNSVGGFYTYYRDTLVMTDSTNFNLPAVIPNLSINTHSLTMQRTDTATLAQGLFVSRQYTFNFSR